MSAHPTPRMHANRVAFLAGTLLLAHDSDMVVSRESLVKLHRAAFDLLDALTVREVPSMPLPERRANTLAAVLATSTKALAYRPCCCTSDEEACAHCRAREEA